MISDSKETPRGQAEACLFWNRDGTRTGMSWRGVGRKVNQDKECARTAARDFRERNPHLFGDDQAESGVSLKEEGNYATVAASDGRIKSVDDLLSASKVDLTEWAVLRSGTKSWEGYAAGVEKGMVWKDGRQTGTDKREGLIVETMRSFWADLARIHPIALSPIVSPIQCDVQFEKPTGLGYGKRLHRALIGADNQLGYRMSMPSGQLEPFHDRAAMDVFLEVATYMQPDRIHLLGDYLDLTLWTDRFVREMEFFFTTQPAIIEGYWYLRRLRMACPNTAIFLHEGNHDRRMRDQLTLHLRAACNLRAADELELPPAMSPEKLLALHKLGVEWVGEYPGDYERLGEGVRVHHGDVARKNGTCQAIASASDVAEVVGHTHRVETAGETRTVKGEKFVTTVTGVGCLCRIDGVVPGHTDTQKWQQAFGVIDYDPHGVDYAMSLSTIQHGRAVWNGELFVGRDYAHQLQKAYPDYRW